ncbi:MAG TPA: hypothetical protein VMG12_02115 [Polyangiaceae bacterium]|nr:hypothetical protein [Polyangiaceae bacterium]
MADLDESRDVERGNDVPPASDDFAAQLAVVFEWHLAQTRNGPSSSSRAPAPANELWMSRITRRTDVTS